MATPVLASSYGKPLLSAIVEQAAEILPADLGMFRLATFGRSFHWMEREKVLLQVWERLESGGGIAIIDSDYHRPWWEHVTTGLILRWRLRDRAVQPKTDSPSERHEAVVEHSRFSQITKGEIKEMESVGIEQILGRIYSTSSGKPELFGENLANFEHDVRRVLGMLEPSGTFVRDRRFSYILARKS
jgi:ubiquinone/menaquinone biosynthesis C-methylase UbiE